MANKFLEDAEVLENKQLASCIWEVTLRAPRTARAILPGQFVHMQVDGGKNSMLRRPFSVFDADGEVVSIIYEVRGTGTKMMTSFEVGDKVSLIAPCGNSWLSTFSCPVYAPPALLSPDEQPETQHVDVVESDVEDEDSEELDANEIIESLGLQEEFPGFEISGDNDGSYFDDLKSSFFDFVKKKRHELPTEKVKKTITETLHMRQSSITINSALLVGGGGGAAPLYRLAKQLLDKGISVDVVMGARTRELLVFEDVFRALRVGNLVCATDDGSYGYSGFCTVPAAKLLEDNVYDYVATCGPAPVMRGVFEAAFGRVKKVEVSCEERMACGIGACKTCVVDTVLGKVKTCECGPIFDAEVVSW